MQNPCLEVCVASITRWRRIACSSLKVAWMLLNLLEPPEMSFSGLFGSMIDRRSRFLYGNVLTLFCTTHD